MKAHIKWVDKRKPDQENDGGTVYFDSAASAEKVSAAVAELNKATPQYYHYLVTDDGENEEKRPPP